MHAKRIAAAGRADRPDFPSHRALRDQIAGPEQLFRAPSSSVIQPLGQGVLQLSRDFAVAQKSTGAPPPPSAGPPSFVLERFGGCGMLARCRSAWASSLAMLTRLGKDRKTAFDPDRRSACRHGHPAREMIFVRQGAKGDN